MLIEERRQLIFKWIQEEKNITIKELEKRLKISMMTINRDLNMLEKQNLIQRVRGGAIKKNDYKYFELKLSERKRIHHSEKVKIAKYAVDNFVNENEIIVLEGGTTVSNMIMHITIPNLRIITNGLNIMIFVSNYMEDIELMCCGGLYFEKECTFVGPQAEDFFKNFGAHKVFFSANSLTVKDGASEWNVPEIGVKQAMIRCAKKRIFLIDSSKFGLSIGRLAVPLEDIDIIVTDKNAPEDMIDELKSRNIEVHIAE